MSFDVSLAGHVTVQTLCIFERTEISGEALVGEPIQVYILHYCCLSFMDPFTLHSLVDASFPPLPSFPLLTLRFPSLPFIPFIYFYCPVYLHCPSLPFITPAFPLALSCRAMLCYGHNFFRVRVEGSFKSSSTNTSHSWAFGVVYIDCTKYEGIATFWSLADTIYGPREIIATFWGPLR